jgi:prophage DNA circulation protein
VIEFALAFIEAGKPAKSSPDRKSRLKAIAARLRTANRTAQRVRRSVLDYGSKTRAILAGDVEDRAQAMLGLQSQFVGSDTSEFSGLLTSMISTADSLVTDSDDEFDAWVDAFDALDEPPDRRTLIGRLAELVQDADDYASAGGLTGSTLALAVESLASAVAVHATAVCAATDIILDDPFEVYDDAVLVLSGMLDAIDVDEPHLTDFDALAALQDLQAEILDALKEDALDLPRLRTLSLDKPTPALVLAYSLYQDAERADEIVMRNGASDPLFLSGDLLVLTE